MFQAVKTDNKLLFENKSKFLLVHASSGFKHSLKEVCLALRVVVEKDVQYLAGTTRPSGSG